ncbi:MAG: hypothetical protein RBU25_16860 [Lentisphaeria bacterium]|jgi:hypothetical protein|nr:hypothetical protein [Lentisphaeria bacterium]
MFTNNQEFELHAVRQFQGICGFLPGYELTPVPCGEDPPDILARNGDHVIGIEVRRLFLDERPKKGSRQREQLGLRKDVISRAQEIHRVTEHRWCTVKVSFSSSCKVCGNRLQKISEMLVDLVCGAALAEPDSRKFRAEDHWGPRWPEEVDQVSATVLPGEGPPEWSISGSAWVGNTGRQVIQDALDEKESKYASFPEVIRDRWLLLVCDGSTESSMLRLHQDIASESYVSSYSRAFVMEFLGRDFAELNIKHA